MSAPPSLTTLPASYANARALAGLPPMEDGGLPDGCTLDGSIEEYAVAVVLGRAVCWLVERPPGVEVLLSVVGAPNGASGRLTVFARPRLSNAQWKSNWTSPLLATVNLRAKEKMLFEF